MPAPASHCQLKVTGSASLGLLSPLALRVSGCDRSVLALLHATRIPHSHGILEQGGCRHTSLFTVQKGVVHGHTTSQDISRHQSRLDLITGSIELVNRGSTFGSSLSTGQSRGQSFSGHHLPAATTDVLTLSSRTAQRSPGGLWRTSATA